jgi:hypothetical protein
MSYVLQNDVILFLEGYKMFHCPECKKNVVAPFGFETSVNGVKILMLYCVHCKCYLRSVNA